jgi:hypothetical protein
VVKFVGNAVTPNVLVSVEFDEESLFNIVARYVVDDEMDEVDGCSVGLGGRGWVDTVGLHKECSCGGDVAVSGVLASRFEVKQWHEGFGDCGNDEVYVGCAVLGANLAMWCGVGRGLSRGGVVLNDGNGCGIVVFGRSGCVVVLCGGMLG